MLVEDDRAFVAALRCVDAVEAEGCDGDRAFAELHVFDFSSKEWQSPIPISKQLFDSAGGTFALVGVIAGNPVALRTTHSDPQIQEFWSIETASGAVDVLPKLNHTVLGACQTGDGSLHTLAVVANPYDWADTAPRDPILLTLRPDAQEWTETSMRGVLPEDVVLQPTFVCGSEQVVVARERSYVTFDVPTSEVSVVNSLTTPGVAGPVASHYLAVLAVTRDAGAPGNSLTRLAPNGQSTDVEVPNVETLAVAGSGLVVATSIHDLEAGDRDWIVTQL